METWDLWFPEAGSQGLPFARAKIDPQQVVWVHAAPEVLRVEVRSEERNFVAFSDGLRRQGEQLPMTRLERVGAEIRRVDRWPAEADIGSVVVLPGGEAGILKEWWNASDESEWRWSVEFYNHR